MTEQIKHNYTGYGWEGGKYQETKHCPIAEIAKMIKADVKKAYPNIKISVRTESFSGGSSIDVKVVDFGFDPLTKQYKEFMQSDKTLLFRAWCEVNSVEYMRYTGEAVEVIATIKIIGDEYRYSDSDAQIDYFDTNFYLSVGC